MFKLLALWRKQAPFIDQKSTNGKQKGVKKFGQPPLPLIWTKSKRTAVFPHETVCYEEAGLHGSRLWALFIMSFQLQYNTNPQRKHIFGNIYLTFFQPLATGMQRAGAHSAALAIATQPYSESLSTVESRNVNFCIDFIYLCLHATESALSETC